MVNIVDDGVGDVMKGFGLVVFGVEMSYFWDEVSVLLGRGVFEDVMFEFVVVGFVLFWVYGDGVVNDVG